MQHFERFGDIRSLFLIRDVLTGDSRRYAFIEFRRAKDADRAYAEGHNTLLDGRRILVDRELGRTEKNWKPRRFGGGFGGQQSATISPTTMSPKMQILNLLHSIRTVARLPLIAINIVVIIFKLLFG